MALVNNDGPRQRQCMTGGVQKCKLTEHVYPGDPSLVARQITVKFGRELIAIIIIIIIIPCNKKMKASSFRIGPALKRKKSALRVSSSVCATLLWGSACKGDRTVRNRRTTNRFNYA